MREVGQICGRCGRRYHVAVDAWADRPGLTGFSDCGCSEAVGLGPVVLLVGVLGGVGLGLGRALGLL